MSEDRDTIISDERERDRTRSIEDEFSALKALVREEGKAYDLFMASIRSEDAPRLLRNWQELRNRLDRAVK